MFSAVKIRESCRIYSVERLFTFVYYTLLGVHNIYINVCQVWTFVRSWHVPTNATIGDMMSGGIQDVRWDTRTPTGSGVPQNIL